MEENIKLRIGTVLNDNGIDILSEDGGDLLHDLYRVIQQELDRAREEVLIELQEEFSEFGVPDDVRYSQPQAEESTPEEEFIQLFDEEGKEVAVINKKNIKKFDELKDIIEEDFREVGKRDTLEEEIRIGLKMVIWKFDQKNGAKGDKYVDIHLVDELTEFVKQLLDERETKAFNEGVKEMEDSEQIQADWDIEELGNIVDKIVKKLDKLNKKK